ncbi:MAG: hypothetical protein V1899_04955, partial [Planctomycetota bacterium]
LGTQVIPVELTVRELRFEVEVPGFRTQQITMVTTLLDTESYPKEDLDVSDCLQSVAYVDVCGGAKSGFVGVPYELSRLPSAIGRCRSCWIIRFRKKDTYLATGTTFRDHTSLFCELVDQVVEKKIPGDFTFDCYFTCADILNHIQGYDRGYVGDCKFNRKIWTKGIEIKASELAASIPSEDRKPVDIDGKRHLGMGDCQIRSGEGQTRHMYLVILAHSLLVSKMRQGRSHEKALALASTIGEACRKILRETLGRTITWAVDRAVNHCWSHEKICAALALT